MKLFRESVLQLPHIYVNFMLLRRDAYSTKPIRISMKNKETKRSVTNNSYIHVLSLRLLAHHNLLFSFAKKE